MLWRHRPAFRLRDLLLRLPLKQRVFPTIFSGAQLRLRIRWKARGTRTAKANRSGTGSLIRLAKSGAVTGDVACDQYHLYSQDIALAKSLNLKSYRFSISWTRIQATGVGAPNMKGIDHYSRFVDALLAAGIRPWCTMFHWDLPQALEDRGGWPNRDLAGYFADYAGILAKHLGDRITVWAPFNMPWAIAFMGYAAGAFPPCRTSFPDFIKAAHTLALAQGEAHRSVKAASSKATVGSAYEMAPAYPKTDSEAGSRCRRAVPCHEQRVLS